MRVEGNGYFVERLSGSHRKSFYPTRNQCDLTPERGEDGPDWGGSDENPPQHNHYYRRNDKPMPGSMTMRALLPATPLGV